MTNEIEQKQLTCNCPSPCSGSVSCIGGCGCLCTSSTNPPSASCECTCQTFKLEDIERSESLQLLKDNQVSVCIKELSIVSLAKFFSYHAPNIQIYVPVRNIDAVINYESKEPESFGNLVKTLGFEII